jgi:hypothetical protein
LERVLAGGNGDIQLRPDGGGASSLAGKQLAVAMAEQHRFLTPMGSKFVIFVRYIFCLFSCFDFLQFGLF